MSTVCTSKLVIRKCDISNMLQVSLESWFDDVYFLEARGEKQYRKFHEKKNRVEILFLVPITKLHHARWCYNIWCLFSLIPIVLQFGKWIKYMILNVQSLHERFDLPCLQEPSWEPWYHHKSHHYYICLFSMLNWIVFLDVLDTECMSDWWSSNS